MKRTFRYDSRPYNVDGTVTLEEIGGTEMSEAEEAHERMIQHGKK